MKILNEILKKNNLRATSYEKIGNVFKVNTNNGKFIIKKTKDN